MTRNTMHSSLPTLATGVIEAVLTDSRSGMHLLMQAEVRAKKIFISLLHHFHAWWRYEITMRELWELHDRELADFGIARKDIPRVSWESSRRRKPRRNPPKPTPFPVAKILGFKTLKQRP